jgi:hypothetical protein
MNKRGHVDLPNTNSKPGLDDKDHAIWKVSYNLFDHYCYPHCHQQHSTMSKIHLVICIETTSDRRPDHMLTAFTWSKCMFNLTFVKGSYDTCKIRHPTNLAREYYVCINLESTTSFSPLVAIRMVTFSEVEADLCNRASAEACGPRWARTKQQFSPNLVGYADAQREMFMSLVRVSINVLEVKENMSQVSFMGGKFPRDDLVTGAWTNSLAQ